MKAHFGSNPNFIEYSLGEGEREGSHHSSMLSIGEVAIRVLFDIRASYSFMCSDLVDILGLQPEIVGRPLIMTNPFGGLTSMCMVVVV